MKSIREVTLGGLEELALTNTLEEVFPETIKALNDAYEMSDTSTYFLDERNIDKKWIGYPYYVCDRPNLP